jgi:uncharacterized protein (DUF488 family)
MGPPDCQTSPSLVFYTLGHSTREIGDFLNILDTYGIKILVDVRKIPQSRRNPQFGKESIAKSLRQAGIAYLHMPELGGLHRPKPDSVNRAWRNLSFRGYADYMQTDEFESALEKLISLGHDKNGAVAIMCAEAVPWRCHRSLVADALVARKIRVVDIITESKSNEHKLTTFAKVKGARVVYPETTLSEDDSILQ